MDPSKNWLESQILGNNIKTFDYAEFSDFITVGEGGSGSVCRANWKSRRMTVALKFFTSDVNFDNTNARKRTIWQEFVREVSSILKSVQNKTLHPYLMNFFYTSLHTFEMYSIILVL